MDSLATQLQQSQTDQRQKSLELREAALLEREALLDDSDRIAHIEELDARIAVLDALVEARTNTKDRLESEEPRLEKEILAVRKRAQATMASIEVEAQKVVSDTETAARLLLDTEASVKDAKTRLGMVEADIVERSDYLKEQRRVVDDTIAEWNIQLTEFHQEASNKADERKKISADIIKLQQLKDGHEAAASAMEDRVKSLQEIMSRKMVEAQSELRNITNDIEAKFKEARRVDDVIETRLAVLNTKEKVLKVREAAVRAKDRELQEREQALNLKLNMVELDL